MGFKESSKNYKPFHFHTYVIDAFESRDVKKISFEFSFYVSWLWFQIKINQIYSRTTKFNPRWCPLAWRHPNARQIHMQLMRKKLLWMMHVIKANIPIHWCLDELMSLWLCFYNEYGVNESTFEWISTSILWKLL